MNRVTTVSRERIRRDLVDLLHRAGDVRDFSHKATRIVRRGVEFDGTCMLTLDPATSLPTGEVSENGLPAELHPRLVQIEIGHGDVNSFRALIDSRRYAASLSAATGGVLERSLRHRELRGPNGFGDELRVALVDEHVLWGGLTLQRGADRDPFTAEDVALLQSLSRHLAEGVRRAVLLSALAADRPEDEDEDEGAAGLVLLAGDDSIVSTDAAGARRLAELAPAGPPGQLPEVIAAVASRARTAADEAQPLLARARVRTAGGAWLIIRASELAGGGQARTAVTIEPAGAHELAPLVADAYGLTRRERVVTQLVAQGLQSEAIAGRLGISRWTVQDHLKSIFEKTGVGSRGALTARMFFEHYAPRLTERAPAGRDGWFTA
jgi:DNA-binding CsgD family transcriptional regulator